MRVRDPQSLHRFCYSHADPVNRIDPSGEFTVVEALVAASIVGTLASIVVPQIALAGGAVTVPITVIDLQPVTSGGRPIGGVGFTDAQISRSESIYARYSITLDVQRPRKASPIEVPFAELHDVPVSNWGLNFFGTPFEKLVDNLATEAGSTTEINVFPIDTTNEGPSSKGFSFKYSGRRFSAITRIPEDRGRTVAHEVGHHLLDTNGHEDDPNNLMATGDFTGDQLNSSQIRTIKSKFGGS